MIVVKTDAGQQVLKDRSVQLAPRQRSLFVLIDGKRTLPELLTMAAGIGVTKADVDPLVELGLIAVSAEAAKPEATLASITATAFESTMPAAGGRSARQRYEDAYPIAVRITATLGLRGFRLNLAVESVGNFEQLLELAPRIKEAVGPEKYAPLDRALNA